MKILIVRLSALGDVVHALPALEVIRAAAPAAELTWAVEALAAPLLLGHPALDRVVVLPRRELLRGGLRELPARAARLGRQLSRLRVGFDAALDLQGLLRSAVVARAAGARCVLGPAWAREGAALLYGRRLAAPGPDEAHAVARTVALARAALATLGLPSAGGAPPARLPEALRDGSGSAARPVILLPGAGKPANRVPAWLLAAIADRCAAAGLPVTLLGGPQDRPLAAAVAGACRQASPAIRCDADLVQAARVLDRAAVVVGGDTGPLHLARALGRPVVALFAAADPARTAPGGFPGAAPAHTLTGAAPCAPCRARRCQRGDRRRVCFEAFEAEAIAEVALAAARGARS